MLWTLQQQQGLDDVTRSDQMDLKVLESLKFKFLMHGLLVCTSLWMIIRNDHSFPPLLLVCGLGKVPFLHLVQSVSSVGWTSFSLTQTYLLFHEHMHVR